MRILICGSRGWKDPAPLNAILAGYSADGDRHVVIHGDARGADQLGGRLARQWGFDVIAEPADWDRYGRAAGPIRNQKMLDEHKPDVVYAFRTYGKSAGTDDMVRRAEAAGLPVYTVTGGIHPTDN